MLYRILHREHPGPQGRTRFVLTESAALLVHLGHHQATLWVNDQETPLVLSSGEGQKIWQKGH